MKRIWKFGWPRSRTATSSLLVALVIPLSSGQNWKLLTYDKIPSHQVEYSEDGLDIKVKKSAAPLIYRLPQVTSVSEIKVQGSLAGHLKLTGQQGDKNNDDFILRVGLVVAGEKKMNWVQRAMAPKWLRELYDVAPKDSGIDRIEFYNIVQDGKIFSKERRHPKSDLIHENFVWKMESEGEFSFSQKLKQPINVLAVWISSDGDDTQSDFELKLSNLILN